MLMTSHYPDLGSASDWSFRIVLVIGWSKIPTQIWVVKCISMEHLAGVFYCAAFVSLLRANASAAASVRRLDRRKSLFSTYETSFFSIPERRFPTKREMKTIKLWKKIVGCCIAIACSIAQKHSMKNRFKQEKQKGVKTLSIIMGGAFTKLNEV